MSPDDALLRPPSTGVPHGSADGWVDCVHGGRHWGLAGAAGLLAWREVPAADPSGGGDADSTAPAAEAPRLQVALQHRAWWSHHGGTWGIPGGAIAWEETPVTGALREAEEEVGLGERDVTVHATTALRHPEWQYTTVVGQAAPGAEPRAMDEESLDARWIDVSAVDEAVAAGRIGDADARPGITDRADRLAATRARRDALHASPELVLLPAFAESWPRVRPLLARLTLVVDAANTVGSVPDGWWRDRAGATARLAKGLAAVSGPTAPGPGLASALLGLPGERWVPQVVLVAEGRARGVTPPPTGRVRIVDAAGEGDDEIVLQARQALSGPRDHVVVVTADRALRARCEAEGASVLGPGTLRGALPA